MSYFKGSIITPNPKNYSVADISVQAKLHGHFLPQTINNTTYMVINFQPQMLKI